MIYKNTTTRTAYTTMLLDIAVAGSVHTVCTLVHTETSRRLVQLYVHLHRSMKRSLDIDNLSLASPCKSAKVECVILQLYPMKGKYFDGRLADDKASSEL